MNIKIEDEKNMASETKGANEAQDFDMPINIIDE